jgi:hypothetical protein
VSGALRTPALISRERGIGRLQGRRAKQSGVRSSLRPPGLLLSSLGASSSSTTSTTGSRQRSPFSTGRSHICRPAAAIGRRTRQLPDEPRARTGSQLARRPAPAAASRRPRRAPAWSYLALPGLKLSSKTGATHRGTVPLPTQERDPDRRWSGRRDCRNHADSASGHRARSLLLGGRGRLPATCGGLKSISRSSLRMRTAISTAPVAWPGGATVAQRWA